MSVPVRRRLWTVLPMFAAGAVAAAVLAPTVGSTAISLTRAFDASIPWATNVDAQIFFVARLPRVLAAAIVGATLAASGVVLQALLRNPLATPFTLRSEEHTSELQSPCNLVCRLLLEKKKTQ